MAARRQTPPQRPTWSGLCPTCQEPLTETRREETTTGARLTYVCARAHAESERWPHVPLRRWKEGAIHTTLSTWTVESDETAQPRPGSLIVVYQSPPLPTTAEDATAAYQEQRARLRRVYEILFAASRRTAADQATSHGSTASGTEPG